MVNRKIILSIIVALLLVACGKSAEPTKTAGQVNAEREAATKASRENPVYGGQLKAMDKAKTTAEDASKKAEERLKQAEDAK